MDDNGVEYDPPILPINWGVASHQWLGFIIPTTAQSIWGMDSFLKGDKRLMTSSFDTFWDETVGYAPSDFMSMYPNLKSIGSALADKIIYHWLSVGENNQNDEKFNEYSPGIDIYALNGVPVEALVDEMEGAWGSFTYLVDRRISISEEKMQQMILTAINLGETVPPQVRTSATAILNTLSKDDTFIAIVATDDFNGVWERGSEALHIDRIDWKMKNTLQDGFKSFIEWVDNIESDIYYGGGGVAGTIERAPLGKGYPVMWIYGEVALNKRQRSVAATREDIRAGRFIMFRL